MFEGYKGCRGGFEVGEVGRHFSVGVLFDEKVEGALVLIGADGRVGADNHFIRAVGLYPCQDACTCTQAESFLFVWEAESGYEGCRGDGDVF